MTRMLEITTRHDHGKIQIQCGHNTLQAWMAIAQMCLDEAQALVENLDEEHPRHWTPEDTQCFYSVMDKIMDLHEQISDFDHFVESQPSQAEFYYGPADTGI